LAVAVRGYVLVSLPGVFCLFCLVTQACPLVSDLLVLLEQLFCHFMHVEAVDLGEMGRSSVLERIDGGDGHAILDVLERSASVLQQTYSSTW